MFKRIYFQLIALIVLSLLLFGCGGAEDGDLTPPNFTFDGGVPAITADPGPHTFSGTTDTDAEIDVEVTSPTTGTVATFTTPVILPDGTWSFDVDNLVEGTNTFAIDVSDPSANSTVYFVTIFLDLTGPVVTFNQYTSYTPVTTQNLAGTVAEFDASVEVLVDSVLDGVADVNGGIWTYSLSLPDDGLSHLVEVRGIDNLGNETDPVNYASTNITVDSLNAPAFTVTQAIPRYVPDPSLPADSLDGTVQAAHDIVLVTSPLTTLVFDQLDPLGVDTWTLDFDNLPSGITVATFSVQDAVPVDVAQANVMIVRDLSGPLVTATAPSNGDLNVNTSSNVVVTFSETMDVATVTNEMIELTDTSGVQVPFTSLASPTADVLDRTFTFVPDTVLSADTQYSLAIVNPASQAATDVYGNEFVEPTSVVTFTTAP